MELNTSLQGDCHASDEEWMPFPEELDILRGEFYSQEFYIRYLYDFQQRKSKNCLLGI